MEPDRQARESIELKYKRFHYWVGTALGLLFLVYGFTSAQSYIKNVVYFNVAVLGLFFLLDLMLLKPISLRMSKDKLVFSSIWRNKLLGRCQRDWNDVHSIWLMGNSNVKRIIRWERFILFTAPGPHVFIEFTSGGFADVTLPMLSKKQAEEFFEGLRKWCDDEKLSSDIIKVKEALLAGAGGKGFTEIWADDLAMRHGSTHFEPLPPDALLQDGRLRVLSELSTGGLSAVYLAEGNNQQRLILKEAVLPPDMDEDSRTRARERFQRECKLLMRVDHPNIARVLDCFVENNRDYLVLDYVRGITLRQLVAQRGAQSEANVTRWIEQLADTLAYLHELEPPVVHRDVTPDNVILRDDGSVVLIDFGAANEFVGTATGTMIGKQCYIAPEQLRGHAEPKSDIYALGATMYFLLTGVDPVALSCSNPRDKQGDVSESTAQLVQNLTRLDAEQRLSTSAVVQALRRDAGKVIKVGSLQT